MPVRGAGSIPDPGAKIPKNQNIKQKQYCNKFNKNLEKKKNSGFTEGRVKKMGGRYMDTGDFKESDRFFYLNWLFDL